MREQDRLGALEVRVPGQVLLGTGRPSAIEQHLLQPVHPTGSVEPLAFHEAPQRGGDLVVAAPPGVQLGARFAGQLGHPPLDRGVDVLVGRLELERAIDQFDLDPVERRQHQRRLLVGQEADARQHHHVRAR